MSGDVSSVAIGTNHEVLLGFGHAICMYTLAKI